MGNNSVPCHVVTTGMFVVACYFPLLQYLAHQPPHHAFATVGLSYYKSNYQDPNISHQGGEDDSEAEDFEVQASDFVILAARNEDEVSHIEVIFFPEGPSAGWGPSG